MGPRFRESISDYDLSQPRSKRSYNEVLFETVALRYDLVTRFLSFGLDQMWKRRLVRALTPPAGATAVDLACGTGDLTAALASHPRIERVIGIDLSREMLVRARRRVPKEVELEAADMSDLPLADGLAGVVTGGYALRNAPDLAGALREVGRVLEPGGKGAFLEFRKSPHPGRARLQLRLLSTWGRLWGRIFHGNPEVYGYIAASLARFPDCDQLHRLLVDLGFVRVRSRRLLLGFLAITRFSRPD